MYLNIPTFASLKLHSVTYIRVRGATFVDTFKRDAAEVGFDADRDCAANVGARTISSNAQQNVGVMN